MKSVRFVLFGTAFVFFKLLCKLREKPVFSVESFVPIGNKTQRVLKMRPITTIWIIFAGLFLILALFHWHAAIKTIPHFEAKPTSGIGRILGQPISKSGFEKFIPEFNLFINQLNSSNRRQNSAAAFGYMLAFFTALLSACLTNESCSDKLINLRLTKFIRRIMGQMPTAKPSNTVENSPDSLPLSRNGTTIVNWDLYGLSEAELHYALAESHLNAAIILATELRNASYPQTFSNAKVIMSLHHHAVELFFKYALSRAGEKVPTHHHIRDLWNRYSIAYRDSAFGFQPPFVPIFLGHSADEISDSIMEETTTRNRNKMDQSMRYHTDRDGCVWPGVNAVLPNTYLAELTEFRDKIHNLHSLIESRMAKNTAQPTL